MMERLLFCSLMMSMIFFPVLKVFRYTSVHIEETFPDDIIHVKSATNQEQNNSRPLNFSETFTQYPCPCFLPLDIGQRALPSKLLTYDSDHFPDRNVLDVMLRLNRMLHLLTPFLHQLEWTRRNMLDTMSADGDPSESQTLLQASSENYFKV